MDKNKRIAVLCGGLSNEREVSLRSGEKVFNSLKKSGYTNAVKIDVDENIAKNLVEEKIEVAFNVLHGRYGEDGCIQGVLEFLKIPYTGSGVKASAVCLDKEVTKTILEKSGVKTIKSKTVYDKKDLKDVVRELEFPLMVKPCSEGSSIAMSKADDENELYKAFEVAKGADKKILIEEYLQGESCTVGVLERDGELFATPVLGFKTKTLWYDFEAKYTQGLTEFVLPAGFDENLTCKIQEIAVKAHKCCECDGVSRVDFLVYNGLPYVLEINTSPGMTDLSDLPAQANAIGISYDALVEMILNTAKTGK